jgi:hypothetical protein
VGKRIEDLRKLDDTPIERQVEALDDRDQPWYQFVSHIDDLLATGQYDWAFDSLDGMKQTIEHTRRVTEGQHRAVAKIEQVGRADRPASRRYEGWGRWGR